MPPTSLMASSTPWPTIAVGVAIVVAVCLWLLFRSGSMADRARADHPDDDVPAESTHEPDGSADGPTAPGDGAAHPPSGGR